jgi:hypothetical protein
MDDIRRTTERVSMDLALTPTAAFDVLIEELATALEQRGMGLEVGPDGRVIQAAQGQPGKLLRLRWHPIDWNAEEVSEVELRLEPFEDGTHVILEHRGWGGPIGDPSELAG